LVPPNHVLQSLGRERSEHLEAAVLQLDREGLFVHEQKPIAAAEIWEESGRRHDRQ
jgi:hypothetical protein